MTIIALDSSQEDITKDGLSCLSRIDKGQVIDHGPSRSIFLSSLTDRVDRELKPFYNQYSWSHVSESMRSSTLPKVKGGGNTNIFKEDSQGGTVGSNMGDIVVPGWGRYYFKATYSGTSMTVTSVCQIQNYVVIGSAMAPISMSGREIHVEDSVREETVNGPVHCLAEIGKIENYVPGKPGSFISGRYNLMNKGGGVVGMGTSTYSMGFQLT